MNQPPRQRMFTGSICFRGFDDIDQIEQYMKDKGPVDVELFVCLPAGLHPDAAVVITKKEKP